MSTGKLFVTVFFAVVFANATTLLALYGARSLFSDLAMPELAGPAGGTSSASAPRGDVATKWAPAIQQRIQQFWIHPPGSWDGYSTVVNVQLEPGGRVATDKVGIVTSSGNAAFDQSVVAAVYDASPLPVPDGRAFEPFRDFDLVLRP